LRPACQAYNRMNEQFISLCRTCKFRRLEHALINVNEVCLLVKLNAGTSLDDLRINRTIVCYDPACYISLLPEFDAKQLTSRTRLSSSFQKLKVLKRLAAPFHAHTPSLRPTRPLSRYSAGGSTKPASMRPLSAHMCTKTSTMGHWPAGAPPPMRSSSMHPRASPAPPSTSPCPASLRHPPAPAHHPRGPQRPTAPRRKRPPHRTPIGWPAAINPTASALRWTPGTARPAQLAQMGRPCAIGDRRSNRPQEGSRARTTARRWR